MKKIKRRYRLSPLGAYVFYPINIFLMTAIILQGSYALGWIGTKADDDIVISTSTETSKTEIRTAQPTPSFTRLNTVNMAIVPSYAQTTNMVPAETTTVETEPKESTAESSSKDTSEDMSAATLTESPVINGPMEEHLTEYLGVFDGPSGRETFYNLNMNLIVQYMRDLGYSEEEYPYWIRDDGCKMLGDYIMVAANFSIRPKGTILETSLGTAIVVDTGSFVSDYPYGIDIAVDW
jgi:hypothetical protein